MRDILRHLQHPDQAAVVDQFPKAGLKLDPQEIKSAIETQLTALGTPSFRTVRRTGTQYRPEQAIFSGVSRVHKATTEPFIILTSYVPDRDQEAGPIPDRETYRALSLPPKLRGFSVDHAEGIWISGTAGKYTAMVQAIDPRIQTADSSRQKVTTGQSYEHRGGIMPASEPDFFKIAAMRALIRLGLLG